MAEEEPWLGLAEAAARKGNDGRLLVQIPAEIAEANRADDRAVTDLLAELAEVRIELARSIAAADTATAVAEARVEARA